jgi:hypothetical protein
MRSVSLCILLALVAGCGDTAPSGGGLPAGIAVIGSDYKSTSVPLADPTTGVITRDGCLTSGSMPPGLTAALSGDVVLPSQPQPGHELVLIDRTNATLTWVDPRSCTVVRQLNVGEGTATNPHDVVAVSAHKAYVTRYAPATSDLLIIDPTAATITGHIDLASYSSQPDAAKAIHPMPDRALLVGGRVYLSLNELSDDFMAGGPARLLVVDPASDKVVDTVDLPTLQNCGSLAALENAHALAVTCSGVFGDSAQLETSGVAWIDLTAAPPAPSVVPAAPFGAPLSNGHLAVLADDLAFTVVPGSFMPARPDALWAFDFKGGAPRKVLDGSGAFTLSSLIADVAAKKLFIGDAADQGARILVIDAVTSTVESTVEVTGLPPRALAFY